MASPVAEFFEARKSGQDASFREYVVKWCTSEGVDRYDAAASGADTDITDSRGCRRGSPGFSSRLVASLIQ